jgi:hypothetical protein
MFEIVGESFSGVTTNENEREEARPASSVIMKVRVTFPCAFRTGVIDAVQLSQIPPQITPPEGATILAELELYMRFEDEHARSPSAS